MKEVLEKKEDIKLMKLAFALEEAALKDDYFIKRKLFPNVDFFSGLILKVFQRIVYNIYSLIL